MQTWHGNLIQKMRDQLPSISGIHKVSVLYLIKWYVKERLVYGIVELFNFFVVSSASHEVLVVTKNGVKGPQVAVG